MKIEAVAGISATTTADAFIISLFQETTLDGIAELLDQALNGAISALVEEGDFSGKPGEVVVLYTNGQIATRRVIVVGLGKKEDFDVDAVRNASAHAALKAKSLKLKHIATILHGNGHLSDIRTAFAIAEATILALYRYTGQKTNRDNDVSTVEILDIVLPDDVDVQLIQSSINEGQIVAESTNLARDLVNLPPNYCTPEYLAAIATEVASEAGLKVEVLDERQMRELKMGALLAVAQGSDTPPRFIILEHNAAQVDTRGAIVLVGKGVTFDTGGYSLKAKQGMMRMKVDMAGGGAVIGAMRAIGLLQLPIHVVGLIPSADNMVNGQAYRPQDVFTASNGTTIEIVSTDAEGRMLLADALVYAERYAPAAIVDIATLTGAAVMALGGVRGGLFTENDVLRTSLMSSADYVNEALWPLPMGKAYQKMLKSETADTKNSSTGPGGASSAAMFLSLFVKDAPWAHIDMAGMANARDGVPYEPQGNASGFGVRLLTDFVRRWLD